MRIALAATLALLLAGCGKLDREHYEQLKMGMNYDEVATILGKADRCDDVLGTSSCIWGKEKKNSQVKFIAGKAALFSSEGIN